MKGSNQLLFLGFILSLSAFSANAQLKWCVAKDGVSDQELQSYIGYICEYPVDCRPIRPGGACFEPNTIRNHASFALDLYYRVYKACPSVNSVAILTTTNPSYGHCYFP